MLVNIRGVALAGQVQLVTTLLKLLPLIGVIVLAAWLLAGGEARVAASPVPIGAGTTVNLRLPSYNLFNLSAGLEFDSGLELVAYVNNLFDENPLLSFDRERGGRARLGYNIGTPRTIGLTVRQAFRSASATSTCGPCATEP